MTSSPPADVRRVHLRLPATSANLGPGFDAMALALELFLEIDAEPGAQFAIHASGRNRNICAGLSRNLLIQTYQAVLLAEEKPVVPLSLTMRNGIPVGMGCGSSAAVRLAGVALAVRFGALGWDGDQILECATRLEGHPDNVAACWYGGMTIAAAGPPLSAVTIAPPAAWRALVVMPEHPVATARARGVLPSSYARADVVTNVQCAALLAAAFALGRADLLQAATRDRLHQPYRGELCPLLPALLPLAGQGGVLSVTLSGAGPSILLLTEFLDAGGEVRMRAEIQARTQPICPVEILSVGLCQEAAAIG